MTDWRQRRFLAAGLLLGAGASTFVVAFALLRARGERQAMAAYPRLRGRPYHFNGAYHETVRLRDGTRVRLRLVRPSDKALLIVGMEHLSPASRYQRFHGAKSSFTEAELHYLTEVDGTNHFALGAGRVDAIGRTRAGLGVARFVRLPDDPSVAEAAVVVADEVQGLGLGRTLLVRLMAAARERGITTLRCYVLGSNTAMQRLLAAVAPDAETRAESGTLVIDVPLGAVQRAG